MLQTTAIYGITFLISLIICRIYEKKEKTLSTIKKVLFIIGITIPPILLASLRYGVGIDYFSYIMNYNTIVAKFSLKFIFVFYSAEPLYVIATYLGYFFTGHFVGAFWVYSIIFMFFAFEGIRYYKDKMSVTLGLFIFYMTYYLVFYNALRQMIAVAIILFASRYLYEKKFWKYLFFVIVAGLFHKSAYVMIFLYLFTFKLDSEKINKWFYIIIMIAPIFMLPFLKVVLWINSFIGIFDQRYSNIEINYSFGFLLYVVPVLAFTWFYRKRLLKLDTRNELFIRILFLQLPAQFGGCFVEYSDRMAVYFGIFQCVLIPMVLRTQIEQGKFSINLPKLQNNAFIAKIINFIYKIMNNRKFQVLMIVGWFLFYYFVLYILMNSNEVYPYRSILSMNQFPFDKVK